MQVYEEHFYLHSHLRALVVPHFFSLKGLWGRQIRPKVLAVSPMTLISRDKMMLRYVHYPEPSVLALEILLSAICQNDSDTQFCLQS